VSVLGDDGGTAVDRQLPSRTMLRAPM